MKHASIQLCLLSSLALFSCDSPFAVTTRFSDSARPIGVRANISSTQPGNPQASLEVLIPSPKDIPESIRQASDLKVVVDNSKSQSTVTQEADGSLRFTIPPSLQKDTKGNYQVILTAGSQSQAIVLETGSLADLEAKAIQVSPQTQVTQGTEIELKAALKNPEQAEGLNFQWSTATALTGPWQPIIGNQSTVKWDQGQVGSYYVRIELTDKQTKTRSSYTSPTPVFQVLSPDNLAAFTPNSGRIVLGESLKVSMSLPELKGQELDYSWSFGTSLQGGFQPISEKGREINWEPPRPGAYYLRLKAKNPQQTSEYTTTKPVIFVSASDNLFSTTPDSGVISRGERIILNAQLPGATENLEYQWSFGFNPQAAFTPIPGQGKTLEWNPSFTGDFYLRVKSIDPQTNKSQTFTSTKTLVAVQDDDSIFELSPQPAQILKGDKFTLHLKKATTDNISWGFSANQQGPFQSISGSGQDLSWTPTSAGSFYLQAKVTESNGSVSTFQSANSILSVSEHPNPIGTESNGPVTLSIGKSIKIKSNLNPDLTKGALFSWGYSNSPQGPFTPLVSIESNSASAVTWYPPQTGSFFLEAQMTPRGAQSPLQFVSSTPLVVVNENIPFFQTTPSLGKVKNTENITITTNFDGRGRNFSYGWAYSSSSGGPFLPMGGSTQPSFVWEDDKKPKGSYFIRFTATPSGSSRPLTYTSKIPLVFITETDATTSQF